VYIIHIFTYLTLNFGPNIVMLTIVNSANVL